jgi:hypothetical protein
MSDPFAERKARREFLLQWARLANKGHPGAKAVLGQPHIHEELKELRRRVKR